MRDSKGIRAFRTITDINYLPMNVPTKDTIQLIVIYMNENYHHRRLCMSTDNTTAEDIIIVIYLVQCMNKIPILKQN